MGLFFNSKVKEYATMSKIKDEYLRNARKYLGEVSAAAEALARDAGRRKRELDECDEEIAKLHGYAERAVIAEADEDAKQYLAKKFVLMDKREKLKSAYEAAAAEADKKSQERDGLINEINALETEE